MWTRRCSTGMFLEAAKLVAIKGKPNSNFFCRRFVQRVLLSWRSCPTSDGVGGGAPRSRRGSRGRWPIGRRGCQEAVTGLEEGLAEVAVRARARPGRAKKKPPPSGRMYSSSGSPSRRSWMGRNWRSMLRWNETNARPWSSWPAPSKPAREAEALAQDDAGRRLGGARVGQADVGVERGDLAVGVGGEVGDVGLAFSPSSGAPFALRRPMSASCSPRRVRSQNSTNIRMTRTDLVGAAGGPGRLGVVGGRPTRSRPSARRPRGRGWPCRRRSPSGCARPPRRARPRRGGCSPRASSAASACVRVARISWRRREQVDVLAVAVDR